MSEEIRERLVRQETLMEVMGRDIKTVVSKQDSLMESMNIIKTAQAVNDTKIKRQAGVIALVLAFIGTVLARIIS